MYPSPAPPYSSGKITPSSPISPSFGIISIGKCDASSHSITCGPISPSANSRTLRRSCCCSSVKLNSTVSSATKLQPIPTRSLSYGRNFRTLCSATQSALPKIASAQASKLTLFIASDLMHPSSVISQPRPSTPPAPAPLPPGPRRNASPPAPNTLPYPAPRRRADAAHRKSPPPSFPFSRSQKSQCSTALSSDRYSAREFPQCLPPAASHFHDRYAIAPATSPAQSALLPRSPRLAASRRRTSSGKSAPFQ